MASLISTAFGVPSSTGEVSAPWGTIGAGVAAPTPDDGSSVRMTSEMRKRWFDGESNVAFSTTRSARSIRAIKRAAPRLSLTVATSPVAALAANAATASRPPCNRSSSLKGRGGAPPMGGAPESAEDGTRHAPSSVCITRMGVSRTSPGSRRVDRSKRSRRSNSARSSGRACSIETGAADKNAAREAAAASLVRRRRSDGGGVSCESRNTMVATARARAGSTLACTPRAARRSGAERACDRSC
mmetsp:Transcript_15024/g.49281  ORF Transcript_15024/g.49281 Transcript_15024/m.49281 type:complete len:243 (-) Transcript_15024:29-757(-)